MRKTLLLLLPLLLPACASVKESSIQRERLSDAASKTLDQVRVSGGLHIVSPVSGGFVVSSDSRLVKISDTGIVVDVSDDKLLLPQTAVQEALKSRSTTAAPPGVLADIPPGSYLEMSPDSPDMVEFVSKEASYVLPMLKLLEDKRCTNQVEVTSVDSGEVFRILLDADCVMDALNMTTSDFLSLMSEDFTITVLSGAVSSFGPTGSSPARVAGFKSAVDPSWDGSSVSVEDLLSLQADKK